MCGSGNNVSTRIGICTRYDRHECSYVATILAEWLEHRGFDVSMWVVPYSKSVPQGVSWDTRQHCGNNVLFTDWCSHLDIVIWIVLPQLSQLQYLRKLKIKSYVLYEPLEYRTSNRLQVYQAADHVLALSRSSGTMCAADRTVSQFVYLPLVPSTPEYKHKYKQANEPVQVVWPIYDGDWRRFDWADMLPRMSQFLADNTGGYALRVVLSSADIPRNAVRVIMRWARQYEFVAVRTCRYVLWRDLQYHGADLMLWPSTVENAMLRGLQAYSHGVPIIGVMASPVSELLAVNPHLAVPVTKSDCDRHGYPAKVSSASINAAMLSRLRSVVPAPAILAEASASVCRFMSNRRRVFSDTMREIFR